MKTDLKVGDSVRVRGAEPVGIVDKVDGDYATVRYEHRPGMFTAGYYPVGHLEVVPVKKKAVVFSAEEIKPRATSADVLPKAL
jgi:hypothetical protein